MKRINIFKNKIVNILGGNIESMYLYGSVVLDDFQYGWSDIDVCIIVKQDISQSQTERLLHIREELAVEYRNDIFVF